jgi:hypothetical protein
MFTKKDFMQNKCSAEQYYAQFVDDNVLNIVRDGLALHKPDGYLMSKKAWEAIGERLEILIKPKLWGYNDPLTLALLVNVSKTAARQLQFNMKEQTRKDRM